MNSQKSTTRKRSTSNAHSKSKPLIKKQTADTLYLMQNENQILRLKNQDLTTKLDQLGLQLRQRTQRVAQAQKQCQLLREKINGSIFVRDIELQNERKIMLDKIALGQQNLQVYMGKIKDARKQVVLEQQRIPNIVSDRHRLEQQLRIVKMENQGSKKTLLTIQQQNQQLRKLNNQLSLKKYTNQPQQKNLSSQIQDRIRYIKSINITEKQLKKQATAKLIVDLIESLFYERKKYSVLNVQRFGLKKSLLRKKMLLIGQIRKGYLNHVKTSVMNKFRQNIKPLQEQQKCIRILQEISKRRQKAKIWRIWRNQTAKAQYSLIRKYQAMNTIQKTCQSLTKSTLIQAFKCLKNPYPSSYHINISTLYSSISKLLTRNLSSFFSSIKSLNNSYQIDQQIEQSATSHSQLLVLSRMFYAWVQMMKQKRMDSLSLKFKYFKRFKKIFVIKKRNVLCDMLSITKGKINDVNMKSLCFAALKQELFGNKSQRTVEEHEKVSNTLKQLKEDTQNRQLQDKVIDKQMALEKVNRYLLKKAKQALEIWRKQHRRVYHAERIFSILSFSLQKSINFAFSRIQVRRFQKLKLSIRDKIASCDYSYNYLVQQNTHIKEVLDKKSHQLQKAKFTAILQRLIRKQKQIKHKFFYKFLRNGFKCWKVKKSIEMMDGLLVKKIKMVFLFLLQQNSIQVAREQKINSYIERHQENQVTVLLKNSLIGFRQWTEKCKRIKRALAGVFDRNSQLQSYQAFGKIKDCSQYIKIHEVFKIQEQTQQQIRQKQSIIEQTTQKIEIFTDRVKTNEKTLENLRASQIFKCYKRFSQTRMRTYVKRWKGKVEQDKGAIKFAKFVSEQTEQMLKQRFLAAFQKAILKEKEHHLKQKSQKFEQELVQMNLKHKKEYEKQQAELNKKRQSNEVNQQLIAEYKPKVQQINKAKVDQFRQQWKKSSFLLALQSWRDFSINKRSKAIKTILQKIDKDMLSQPFKRIVQTAGLSYRVNPLVHLLQQIVHKSFVQLIIHQLSAKDQEVREKKISQIKLKLEQIRNDRREIMGYEEFTTDECSRSGWDTLSEKLKRQAVTQWRTFASVRTQNKRKAGALKNWLNAGYQAEFITILLKHRAKLQRQDALITKFEMNTTQRRAKIFMNYLLDIVSKKSSIKRLFLQKFCFHQVYSLQQRFFTQTKNYLRSKQTSQKDHKTYCLQKLLGTFQKKRKDILCQNMNKWRRNMELIVIEKNLMKRVVRNAMNRRVKDLFYAWKLQKEARFMIKTHTQEGQVKKRKMEIQRLKKFLDDYKKEKGLLLENQEGNYVVSPKFQESKEKQLKRQNLLKYKFISRLILSMNGYQAPVKAWNNLQMFAKLRQKCQKAALFVKNRMQKGDLFTSFRIWSDATKQLRKMFDNMERKDLIKLLNRQKDKMEMEYSKKIEVQEKISKQLRRYKVLSYQDKRKERICAQILFREARKVKSYAFDVWRKRVQESKDNDAYELQQKGSNKVMSMEEEVLELERRQRQLYEHNMMLKQAVQQALELADMIKRISDQRDALKRELSESDVTCQNLQQQNEILNNKLILAQKQAMNLLTLSNKGL